MAVRVIPGNKHIIMSHVLTELAANHDREQEGVGQNRVDICDWGERHFYIPFNASPITIPLHQKAILRYFFTRNSRGRFPFQNLIYSTCKKSGKSTIAGLIARYFAETQTRYGEIYTTGNDLEQAKDRSYKEVVRSIELTPGFDQSHDRLPGRWRVNKLSMRCLLTGSLIKAIAVDAKGEAGGQPALTIWTELWGAENIEAKRFWDEMTPIPTVPDSLRLVETYAGYDGESELLRGLYDVGMEGHQLTNGELARAVCRPGVEGEEYEDFLHAWFECDGDPDAVVPMWVNETASLAMYWDSGMNSRRMPWQHMFQSVDTSGAIQPDKCYICGRPSIAHDIGITADEYYAAQASILTPNAFNRLHLNMWVGAEEQFIPMELWDQCGYVHDISLLSDEDRTPIVVAADAAVTKDCFGIVAVQRCPHDDMCVDIRALKKWAPQDSGGTIDLSKPEEFLTELPKHNNVIQITYDRFQLESIAQNLKRKQIVWLNPFNQMGDRLAADSQLYDLIVNKRIHYHHEQGCRGGSMCDCWLAPLREHVANANGKLQKDEDSKVRIVKKSEGSKIDLIVCLAMASYRCLYLKLGKSE